VLVDVEALGRGKVVAVGAAYEGGRARAIALQRNRRAWRAIHPHVDSRESAFVSVTQDPRGRPWAVGWQLRGGEPHPLVATWTGKQWVTDPGATLGAGSAVLTDIAFRSEREGWAVGYRVAPRTGRHHATLQRWDGQEWAEVPLPWARRRSMVPRAVAFDPSGRPAIAGFLVAGDKRGEVGFVATRQRGRWALALVGQDARRQWELLDIAAVGDGFLSVGGVRTEFNNRILVRADCGGRATTQARPAEFEPPTGSRSVTPQTTITAGGVALRDVAGAVGLAEVTTTYGAIVADFNRDRWPDVAIGRHGRIPSLMLGGRARFRRARNDFPKRDYHGCDAADVDGDREPDLFCATGAFHGSLAKSNALWLHPARGRLRPVAATMGVVDPFGVGRRATFLNWDGDRYPDLYVTNEPDRVDAIPSTNRLFRNVDGARYVPAPEGGLDRSFGGSCAVAADLDADGDDELLVCATEPWSGRPRGLRVFRNDGGHMVEVSAQLGIRPAADVDALVTDLNGDDRPDIIQLSRGVLRIHLGTASGARAGYRRSVSDAAAVAAGDANGDGRMDLYVAQGASGGRNDLLLINQGRGRSFRPILVPGTARGKADDVVTIDHDRNGLDDFLVLNGARGKGPIQLMAAFRRRR
jgi:hypothetical protein